MSFSDSATTVDARAAAIFEEHRYQSHARIDRLFAGLLVLEWLGAIVAAQVVAPRTWIGAASVTHLHVWAAVLLGGAITIFPALLGVLRPGFTATRHTIAVAQMLMSALLIDVTGGRIETHFHVFGSLAFLAFYRDWKIFGPATFVVAADHLLRGIYWPESVYGVSAAPWRWLEHSSWVLFEDIFLVNSCLQSVRELRGIASQQAQLEQANQVTEQTVRTRTAELRASEEVFRSLSAASPVGIFRTDATGALLYCNARWTETVGRSEDDVLHADWARDVDTEDAGILAPLRNAMAQGADETAAELRIRRPDGAHRWVHVSVKPVVSEVGTVVGHVGTLQDISDRKRAELDREAEARTAAALVHVGRELISSLETPVLLERVCHLTATVLGGDYSNTWLRDEDDTYRVIAGHGLDAEQWEALRTIRVHGDALPHLVAALTVGEIVVLDPDRVPDPVLQAVLARHGAKVAACIPLLRSDGLIGLQVVGYRSSADVFTSEHERVARGIVQLASMALANARLVEETTEASRLKSEFLSTMSHELRTPLNVILGYTEMLGDAADYDERVSLLDRVRQTSLELLDMVTSTLDLSRIAAGEDCLDVAAVALGPLLSELEIEFAAVHRRPDVDLRWAAPADAVVRTDKRKLATILKNLVGNAIKFTPAGTVTIDAAVGDGRCVVTVADTGVGIAPECVPFIFDMFRQADSSETRSYGGVGLGLYIVKTLTAQLGARIDVETALGSGSTFRVTLPLADSIHERDAVGGGATTRLAPAARLTAA